MDPLQELIDLEALRRLKARYWYCWDTKDRKCWLSLFAPDGSFQWETAVSAGDQDGRPGKKYVGKELELVVSESMDSVHSVHLGHSPILEILSPTEARGIWAMEDIVETGNGMVHGYGHYHETYRKIDGEWKISTSYLSRRRLVVTQR